MLNTNIGKRHPFIPTKKGENFKDLRVAVMSPVLAADITVPTGLLPRESKVI